MYEITISADTHKTDAMYLTAVFTLAMKMCSVLVLLRYICNIFSSIYVPHIICIYVTSQAIEVISATNSE